MEKNKRCLVLPELVILILVPCVVHSYSVQDLSSIAQQIERYRDNACEDYNKYFCQFQFQASNNYAMYSKHNVPILKGNNLYTEAVEMLSSETYNLKHSKMHKTWFESCYNSGESDEGINAVKNILESFGSWPMLTNDRMRIRFWSDITELYSDMLGENVFFNIERVKEEGKVYLLISKPKDGVIWDYLEHIKEMKSSLREEIRKHISILEPSGNFFPGSLEKLETFIRLFSEIIKNEDTDFKVKNILQLQTISDTYYENNNPKYKINWLSIFNNTLLNAVRVQYATTFKIDNRYFKDLCGLLSTTANSVIVNFLHWAFVFNKNFYSYWNMNYLQSFDETERKTHCIDNMPFRDEVLQNALKVSIKNKTARVETMFKHIMAAYKTDIAESWMNSPLKKYMISQISKINLKFNNLKTIDTEKYSFELTGKIVFDWISYMRIRNYNAYKYGASKKKLHIREKREKYVSRDSKTIIVDPQIFVTPMFVKDAPEAAHYGSIGFILAESIAHSMSTKAFVKHEKSTNLWNFEMLRRYIRRTDCLVKEYDNLGLSGEGTLEGNIATSLGLKLAFNAFKNAQNVEMETDFDENTLFFTAFAHDFCQKLWDDEGTFNAVHKKINGALKNSKQYLDTFQCREGNRLYSSVPFDMLLNKIIIKDNIKY